MSNTPENTNIVDDEAPMQRTIQIATAAIIVNKLVTTHVTLEIRPNKGNSNITVALAHRNIFFAIRVKDYTLKIVTPQNDIIDTLFHFPDESNYTKIFKKIFKCSKTSRIYISHHIELTRSIGKIKDGSNHNTLTIFDTLVNNSVFLSYDKFQSHKEHAI